MTKLILSRAIIPAIAGLTLLAACANEPGLFAEQEGKFTASCDADTLTFAAAEGNVELAKGEKNGGAINERTFVWYCGQASAQNRHIASCYDGSNFVEITRNHIGPIFEARCYDNS